MGFSAEVAVAVIVTFLLAYYLGWWARGRWEAKKHLFVKTKKNLKKVRKK